MSDPRDTDPRHADLKRRLDPDAPGSGRSMWPWLAALVAFLALIGMSTGYNWTERASDNQSNAPTTTGAAEPRAAPPANPGGDASRPTPAMPTPAMPTPAMPTPAPTPNEGPR
jgi:hypothetical protein